MGIKGEHLAPRLCEFIAGRFNSGNAVSPNKSLFYSGMIDSLGIAEIASFLTKERGKVLEPTTIVENDLDTVELLVNWVCRD
ncbi:MAG: hypothetical protein HUU29_10195 [Planctomycetaceae bacterium]|nr:hypothetical protein [Planctomycetaceae bacterium]